jgi:hypothetical protein
MNHLSALDASFLYLGTRARLAEPAAPLANLVVLTISEVA